MIADKIHLRLGLYSEEHLALRSCRLPRLEVEALRFSLVALDRVKSISALWASPGVKGLIDRNTSLHLSKWSMHLITGIYHLSNSKNNYTPEADVKNGNSLSSSKSFFFPR